MAINFKELLLDFGTATEKPKPKQRPTLENIVSVVYRNTTEKSGPWIVGGCARQVLLGEDNFNDIDVWFKDIYQFEQLKQRLSDEFGYEMYEHYVSDNAITYHVGDFKVQLIRRAWYPSLQAVFDSFDFTCCQLALDDNLTAYGPGEDDARNLRLRVNHLDKNAFLSRYAKYVGYGYSMDPSEFLKIIDNMDLNYEFYGRVFVY